MTGKTGFPNALWSNFRFRTSFELRVSKLRISRPATESEDQPWLNHFAILAPRPKLHPMKGVPTRLRRQGAALSLIATIIAGAALVAPSALPSAPALAADAPLPPSTPAFSPAGLNLGGHVVSDQGAPVPGARVFIDAAKPRVGRGYT